jgi:hypothetical protein
MLQLSPDAVRPVLCSTCLSTVRQPQKIQCLHSGTGLPISSGPHARAPGTSAEASALTNPSAFSMPARYVPSGHIVRGADAGCGVYSASAVTCPAFQTCCSSVSCPAVNCRRFPLTVLMEQEIHDVEALQTAIDGFHLNETGL